MSVSCKWLSPSLALVPNNSILSAILYCAHGCVEFLNERMNE